MKTIFLIAGHSGKIEPGAQAYDGTWEADYTMVLRNKVHSILKQTMENVLAIRGTVMQDPDNASLQSTIATVNKYCGADDFAIDLHFNNNNPNATGTEAFVHDNTSPTNRACAERMVSRIAKLLGIPNRAVKSEQETAVKRLGILHTNPKVILLESCFLNEKDLPRYLAHIDGVAAIIAEEILAEYGH